MKFMLTFDRAPDTESRATAIERFQASGGIPPEGVKLLGRWTQADLGGGFGCSKRTSRKKLGEFAFRWSDLMCLTTIMPVVEHEELGEVFARGAK